MRRSDSHLGMRLRFDELLLKVGSATEGRDVADAIEWLS